MVNDWRNAKPPTNNLFRKTKIRAIGFSSAYRTHGMSGVETRMDQTGTTQMGRGIGPDFFI
jgi:hypothetical protein